MRKYYKNLLFCILAATILIPGLAYSNLGKTPSKKKIRDYSGIRTSEGDYLFTAPKDIEKAKEIIKNAYEKNIPIRICGGHHSTNGFSLPRDKEILIDTKNLNYLEFFNQGTVRVGAGSNLVNLNHILESYGFRLPIINGGSAGPTVGGFISAGGMSNASVDYGGFWEIVREITLITGDGKILKINRQDPIFRWIFGSMGQLGLIYEAVLELKRLKIKRKKTIPFGKKIIIKSFNGDSISMGPPLYWINFLTPKELVEKVRSEFQKFKLNYDKYFLDLELVEKEIKYNSFYPPLIFDDKKPFVVQVLWGHLKTKFKFSDLGEMDFQANLLARKYKIKRYVQVEFNSEPVTYKNNWGESYNNLYLLKKKLDPKLLFNPGLF